MSNMNVSLSDLALTIRARATVNLLDRRHYHFTLEQLEKSAKSGSLFKKSKKISIRKVEPDFKKDNIDMITEFIPTKLRSLEKEEEETVSDEDLGLIKDFDGFNNEDLEMEEADRMSIIKPKIIK